MSDTRAISIYSAANAGEAYVVKELLDEAGINAEVVGENLGALAGELPFGRSISPRLLVAEADAVRAREIVSEYERKNKERAGKQDRRPDDTPAHSKWETIVFLGLWMILGVNLLSVLFWGTVEVLTTWRGSESSILKMGVAVWLLLCVAVLAWGLRLVTRQYLCQRPGELFQRKVKVFVVLFCAAAIICCVLGVHAAYRPR
jgi:hypothetical protein